MLMFRFLDFGLATFSGNLEGESTSQYTKDVAIDAENSLTVGVGTALYRAPEYETHEVASREQGDRADMYSLGIVLFEMVHQPFSTGMERVRQIMQLRDKGEMSDISPAFDSLKKMIASLINKEPSKRPSADELLQSSMIPPRVGIDKAYLKEILRSLMSNANQEVSAEIISALFKRREYPEYTSAAYEYSMQTRQSRWLNLTSIFSDTGLKRVDKDVPLVELKKKLEISLSAVFELFGGIR
jgi:eukaryotic translation initiation factor 2-alpha kinase 4